jgi:hypothetical protein
MVRRLLPLMMLLACAACDDKKQETTPEASAPTASAPPAASSAPAPPSSLSMPERPVPKGQTMVSASAPIEQQQKAIAYMVAMRAPRVDEQNSDPAYANDLASKLRPIILSMDNGADKARLNRVEVVSNGRQIDLLMAGGCDEHTPVKAVVQRAGVPLATLVLHGVLVVRCNDARIQCLQSTRDADDVLCTTAPRHK